jgi:hypothetical protein
MEEAEADAKRINDRANEYAQHAVNLALQGLEDKR